MKRSSPRIWSRVMTDLLRRLVRDESGQDIIEYALMAAGIAVLVIPTVGALRTAIIGLYTTISGAVSGLPGS